MSVSFPTEVIARLTDPSNNANISNPVHAVTFSAGTGQYILTGSQDRAVRLFNPSTSKLIQTYRGHGYEVLDLAVGHDNRTFASVGGDKTAFLWDVETAQATRRFAGHAAKINACTFGGNGDHGGAGVTENVLITGSLDGTLRIWDLKARSDTRPIMTLHEAKDAVSDVHVVGNEIFASSVDGCVRIYDIASGFRDTDVVAPGVGITSVSPTRAGDAYLVNCLDSKLRFMDRLTGRCLKTLEDADGFRNEVYRIRATMAVGDALVVAGSENGWIVVWDVLTGEVLHRLRHGNSALAAGASEAPTTKKDVVSAVAWNQLRKQMVSAGGDGVVVVWGSSS